MIRKCCWNGEKREFRSSCPTSWGLRWFGLAWRRRLMDLGVEMDREFGVEENVTP